MEFIKLILNWVGIDIEINDETSPLLLFFCAIFCMSLLTLNSFLKILIYLINLYITEHKLFLEKINKYPYLTKLLNYYRKTRLSFLIFEILFFTCSLIYIAYLCFKIIYAAFF